MEKILKELKNKILAFSVAGILGGLGMNALFMATINHTLAEHSQRITEVENKAERALEIALTHK